MTNLRVLIADTYDPWFNLASEAWMFNDLDPSTKTLFLWRNKPTVVIGRSQNPWVECHLDAMEQDGVLLARRQSGGGAVFHDLGNTNFTFLSSKANYNKSDNFNIIKAALKTFDISADTSGRNDLVVNQDGKPRKVSGSAFRETKERAFHHGTLLINADLDRLQQYLNPSQKKLQAKGVTSVKSRVANLIEFNPEIKHESFAQALIDAFAELYQQPVETQYLNTDTLRQHKAPNDYYQTYQNWDWRFGKTFEFSHQFETRFDWGIIDIRLKVDKGIIIDAEVYSDCLYPDFIDAVKAALVNTIYQSDDIIKALAVVATVHSECCEELSQLNDWIIGQLCSGASVVT